MANETIQTYDIPKGGYTTFDAISLRNLIIQRLNEQGILTDQNYIGSNLASIIDIISYAFNTLIFYLNKTSSESMFTEAQLTENINKIVKILDYKPIGYQTSTLVFSCSADTQTAVGATIFSPGTYTIPRYSYVGSSVKFSFNEDVTFVINSDTSIFDPVNNVYSQELSEIFNKKLLYQGIYREYPQHIAAGDINELVVINVANSLIDHFNLDVYVYESEVEKWVQYKHVHNFYTENATSRSFEKRLNSQALYEITFGDGINGRKLQTGDKVQIYFLQSTGENGVVGPRELKLGSVNTIYTSPVLNEILIDVNYQNVNYLTNFQFARVRLDNFVGSTKTKNIEDVDSVRKNAPSVFRSQYRLVTQEDFKTHINTNFSHFIHDVQVFNNWDYTGKYLKYFYDLGVRPEGFKQIMLNQVSYADACNFNNIYICAIPRVSPISSLKYLLPSQKEAIISGITPLKTLTSEITFMDPVYKAISFGFIPGVPSGGAADPNSAFKYQLVAVYQKNTTRSPESIVRDIATTLRDFFKLSNTKLGRRFDYTTLYNNLLNIDGIVRLYTRNIETNETREGISFYMWNINYPTLDAKVVSGAVTMQEFEIIYFTDLENVESRIAVIKET